MVFLYFTHVLEAAEGLNAAEFSESTVIRRRDFRSLLWDLGESESPSNAER